MKIKYVTGDLFAGVKEASKTERVKIIHCCNTLGVMGSGFVVPLKQNYPGVDIEYSAICQRANNQRELLGYIDIFKVNDNLSVYNMIGQLCIGPGSMGSETFSEIDPSGRPPIRYGAIMKCCSNIAYAFKNSMEIPSTIHAPLFGAGLAGGNWDFIEQILIESFIDNDIPVTIYQMPGQELRPSENI